MTHVWHQVEIVKRCFLVVRKGVLFGVAWVFALACLESAHMPGRVMEASTDTFLFLSSRACEVILRSFVILSSVKVVSFWRELVSKSG